MTITLAETWTKQLVQDHAKTAVAVELYTLPFYLTALASIQDKNHDAYKSLLSICIEEMLHLQLAANLCLALDTQPEFTAPKYDGKPIPYLDPNNPDTGHHKLINAKLDALNTTTLDLMLDIETPSGLEPHRHPEKGIRKVIDLVEDDFEKIWNIEYHQTPQYPYETIGEMYDALIAGISHVGENNFSWNTQKQQALWREDKEGFTQKITNFKDAQEAVKTISFQGEGTTAQDKFAVPEKYRLEDERDDTDFNEYSHYERLLEIKKQGLPTVYTTNNDGQNTQAQLDALKDLQLTFTKLLGELDSIWTSGDDSGFWETMTDQKIGIIVKARICWQVGVIPQWS